MTTRTDAHTAPRHPLGTNAKILLCSVFGPYAQDDTYGARRLNPMELYQNQVTRAEGPFSLRMFHRSWGIMLIHTNISAPCTLLDFPTLERFIREVRDHAYDIVGISAIPLNIKKVQKMCEVIRAALPRATIVIGGHIANVSGLEHQIDADHIARGEGVRWFRRFLGEDTDRPIHHPQISSAIGTRAMGVAVKNEGREAAATVVPSVGCPMGCNFCATSAMFGGKGKFVNLYETGDELFAVMSRLERAMGVRSFFVMDENFLLHRKRALRLLELMEQQNKAWALYVFSSGQVLRSYDIDQLVRLGISWVWMGLEGKQSQYVKLKGINTFELVRGLQANGIKVLGSSIIGLEEHTPENMHEVIEYAISHATDFHQFMLYTPVAGTPLYAQHVAEGTLKDPATYDEGDIHGQLMFRHQHAHITAQQETQFILHAFQRDFSVNGPSVLRIARTLLQGWRRHRRHSDPRVRRRFAWEARDLVTTYPATLWAAQRWFRERNQQLSDKLGALLYEITREVGVRAKLIAPLGGRYVLSKLRREEQRLKAGWTYEPPTFYEMNPSMARLLQHARGTVPTLIRWVPATVK